MIAQVICEHVIAGDFSASLNDSLAELDLDLNLNLDLEPIVGTNDFRVNSTIDLSGKPWYDDRKEYYRCVRPAKCEKIQNSTCFGSKVQFKYTSVQLSNEESQENSLKKLYQLEAFRNVPECWAVIQVHALNFSYSFSTYAHYQYPCSHFCVPFICQDVSEAKSKNMFICHRTKCVEWHPKNAVFCTIRTFSHGISNATKKFFHVKIA